MEPKTLKKTIKSYLILLPISTLIVALDQWTKSIIRSSLAFGEMWVPRDWLAPYARIVHWYNTGVAFGMFQDRNLIFAMLSLIVSAALIIFYPKITQKDWFLRIAIGMQVGGSIGNLIDRLTIGHVTDFISVGNFPVFNIADASITVGVGVMLIGLWLEERNEKKAAATRIEE
jgi:signal peptidase II